MYEQSPGGEPCQNIKRNDNAMFIQTHAVICAALPRAVNTVWCLNSCLKSVPCYNHKETPIPSSKTPVMQLEGVAFPPIKNLYQREKASEEAIGVSILQHGVG